MHVLPTSNVKFSKSQVNHTFSGTFCLLFRKFALKQGQIFGADAPYLKVGFAIPKWHTRVKKSGKNPPPPPRGFTYSTLVKSFFSCNLISWCPKFFFSRWSCCSGLSRQDKAGDPAQLACDNILNNYIVWEHIIRSGLNTPIHKIVSSKWQLKI